MTFLLGFFIWVSASNSELNERAQQIDQYLVAQKFSGVVRLKCGDTVYLDKAYGPRQKKLKGRYFDIGSVSKQFTAAAIMKLAEQGKLKLSDPLSKFISPLPKRARRITIEDLVSHRSGLSYPPMSSDEEEAPQGDVVRETREMIREGFPPMNNKDFNDFISEELQNSHWGSQPGEKFSYHNLNYNILAYIVSKSSRQPFNSYVKEHLLAPARVKCGFNDKRSIPRSKAAIAHYKGNPIYRAGQFTDGYGFIGATGIVCRASDVEKWYESLPQTFPKMATLNRYRYLDGAHYLNPRYAYGLEFEGSQIFHSGSTVGFSADTRHDPTTNCTSIALSDEDTDKLSGYPATVWFEHRHQPVAKAGHLKPTGVQ